MANYTIINATHLIFNTNFNEPFYENYIPNNTTHITFGWHFDQQFLLAKTISFVL